MLLPAPQPNSPRPRAHRHPRHTIAQHSVRGFLAGTVKKKLGFVDVLDARNASFVSVTQQFNTTSMGRLTLNVLLSFAQFEREIAGERIRDKIAASKRKGMWMGSNVPLGYDVKDRKLIVNEPEAATVRVIFRRYAELGVGRAAQDRARPAGSREQA
jgi:DNA invertase Pin-like site-specific DNA recombinase